MHYYTFNIGDYRADTAHLTCLEHGIYRQLIDQYYLNEAPIPLETQVVMRRLCLGLSDQQTLETILSEYFKKTEKGWIHTRCDDEITYYRQKTVRNQHNGKLGGRPKKTQVVSKNNPLETQTKPQPITNNQEPITIKKEKTLSASDDAGLSSKEGEGQKQRKTYPPLFEQWWDIYPPNRKPSKAEAFKQWKAQKVNGHGSELIDKLGKQIASGIWGEGQKYCVNAHKYIKERRWEVELTFSKTESNPWDGAI